MADDTRRVEGNYSAQWLSLHSDHLRPQYLPELYKLYGRRFDALDMLWMTQKKGTVMTRNLKLWEENNIKPAITLNGAINTGAVKADITFKISAADYDTNGNPAVRIGQTVYIPAAYQPSGVNVQANYQVVSRSGSAGDYTFTARPFLATAQIATQVPTATKLSLGAIQFAPGTGLPEGMTQAKYQRNFSTAILKERLTVEGGFFSQEQWTPIYDGNNLVGYANKLLNDVEFRLDDQLNEYLMFGQANGNTALVGTSQAGGSNAVLSGTGLWNAMDSLAQPLWYTNGFEVSDVLRAKKLFESQGSMYDEVLFPMGSDIHDDIFRSVQSEIREYSSGTDLLKNMTDYGFTPRAVTQNGVTVIPVPLASFTNPNGMGNPVYGHSYDGFMMPTSKAKVSMKTATGDKTVMINHAQLHFLGSPVENRTRVLGDYNGISGMQGVVTNQYDIKTWGMLTEPMLVYTNLNQCIIVRKEA